jgi:diguanylate cyclase (GGDEF)-like protein
MWQELWTPPSGDLGRAAYASERFAARARLVVLCMLIVIPIGQHMSGDAVGEILVGSGCLALGIVHSLLQIWATRREIGRRWLGFASSLGDVTFISLALGGILLTSGPHAMVNNKVLFAAYFLVIASTSLRYDPRICLSVGLLAMLQYGGLIFFVATNWDLSDPQFAPYRDGVLKASAQVGRVIVLAAAAGMAAATVVRMRRLALLSTRDSMTGLVNRRFLDERLQEVCSHWERDPLPISFVLIDVDGFKGFNDRHGHAAGDMALRCLALVLRECFRASDTVARFGGEEFAVLMEGATRATVHRRCEDLRARLAETPIPTVTEARITISAGVAVGPEDGERPIDLVRAADRRLYAAKASGRNRVHYPKKDWVSVLEIERDDYGPVFPQRT